MSSPEGSRRSTRTRSRRPVLDVDLNDVPPCESCRAHEGTSNVILSQNGHPGQVRYATTHAPIDVDALDDDDDDVIICSPRAFNAAKRNSRTVQGRSNVVDIVSAEDRLFRNKRRGVPETQKIINCDLYINLECSSSSLRNSGWKAAPPTPPPPPPPPKEPTFNCPVCMGPLFEEMSTKCGHIFCKKCIKAAIAAQSKCPTCRKKTTVKDLIRIYLPATSS